MAGNAEDPTQWRLRTDNGIPYKLAAGVEGEFERERGNLSQRVLIPANRLPDFLSFMLPAPIEFGQTSYPTTKQLIGLPALGARKISFRSLDSDYPIDPWGFDSGAPANTYFGIVECTIHYDTEIQEDEDPDAFLEVNASATGDFLHAPMPNGVKTEEEIPPPPADEPQEEHLVEDQSKDDTNENDSPLRDPLLPVVVMVPMVQWSVKWRSVPYDLFTDKIRSVASCYGEN